MRTSAIWSRFALGGALLTLFVCGSGLALSQSHAHSHRGKKHSGGHARPLLSAQEARAARERKAALARKLRGLHSHIHQVRAKIHKAKVQENQISESLQTVEARMERTKTRLVRADARLETLDAEHTRALRRLDATQKQLAERRRLLAERIRYNYQRGRTTYAQALLESRSMHDLLSRSHYVRQIVHSDTELIQGVRDDIRQIEADKRLLEQQAREQKALAAELQERKQEYAADADKQRELLHNARRTRQEAEGELDELESESEEMTTRIRSLSEALRARQEAERQAALGGHRGHEHSVHSLRVWRGGFIRPCDGPITSGFGYRFHPILHRRKLHTGVDFGAGYGAPIHAAAGGTVLFAAYTRGYGNCVIIDHGGGVTTLYGHASALLVSEGETVRQGQVVARVGATGLATGPHLHFEVRHNGVPVSPL